MLLTGLTIAALVVTGAAPVQDNDVSARTGVFDAAPYPVGVPADWNGASCSESEATAAGRGS